MESITKFAKRNTKLLIFSIVIFELFITWHVVAAQRVVEPDEAYSLILWDGIRLHGLGWVTHFNFPPDHMLFTLVPIHFVLYWIFGPNANIPIFCGIAIYLANALIATLLLKKVSSNKFSLISLIALLNLNNFSHAVGFATYSDDHIITSFFGMCILHFVVSYFRFAKKRYLVGILIITAFDALSDPWMISTYFVPLLVTLGFIYFNKNYRLEGKRTASLIATLLLAMFFTETKFLGVFHFLPRFPLHIVNGQQLRDNTYLLLQIYLRNFNFAGIDISNNLLRTFCACLLFVIIFYIAKHSANLYRNGSNTEKFFILFAPLSILSISASYILTNMQPDISSARYLINSEYLIVMLFIFVLSKTKKSEILKKDLLVYSLAVSFSIASIASNLTFTNFSIPVINRNDRAAAIERVLQANGLTYGYGTYWGSMANSVTVETKGKIIIRPIVFDSNGGVHFQGRLVTSNLWYVPADFPSENTNIFLIMNTGVEGCGDVHQCVQNARTRFGQPIKEIQFNEEVILVWDHQILNN